MQVETVDLGGTQTDFSMWGMFVEADIIVQAVMIMLIMASFWSWAIMFEKFRLMRQLNSVADEFEEMFWSGNSLEVLYTQLKGKSTHPLPRLFVAAMREWKRSNDGQGKVLNKLGLSDRLTKVMRVTISREMDRVEKHINFLATVGSTAPFVGLFGTVWGIMNSFQSIALSSNTSLAVVAPGIAEALFATALGLIAAIPAVMAYNKLTTDIERFALRVEGFADEFSAILSRQMEEKAGHIQESSS